MFSFIWLCLYFYFLLCLFFLFRSLLLFFFFNDTATPEIYTLSLHDALPICRSKPPLPKTPSTLHGARPRTTDLKSTRLNSCHLVISYAVFCLKKKNKKQITKIYNKKKQNNQLLNTKKKKK